jgi:hypothetical protein
MIFPKFKETKGYDPALETCIVETVEKLEQNDTDVRHPALLLGNIQSGKTRCFIGIMALAFDKGYDMAIILTKGTRALANQTIRRLENEFEQQIIEDDVKVYDILNLPTLTPWLLNQKLIIVVKKETNNLDRLQNLFETYDQFKDKRALFIDDEADFASNGFKRDQNADDGVAMNTLATKISGIRQLFEKKYDFLQVTATPYNLYLQPEVIRLNGETYAPMRPKFTSIVPIHDKYVGGKVYFEDSELEGNPANYIHVPVTIDELDALSRSHATILRNVLTTPRVTTLRNAITSYFIAGAIRNLELGKIYKSSFLFHTEISKAKHDWQMSLITEFLSQLRTEAQNDSAYFKDIIRDNYQSINTSARLTRSSVPSYQKVYDFVKNYLTHEYYGIVKVNSDNDIMSILGADGQLRLDNPYNIFVGGYTLDRGITISNLLGFFYGRNPRIFQQDTVLQHSRMYGARAMDDVSVTRLYTTNRIHRVMARMHHLDSVTRQAFLRGENHDGVAFVERDPQNEIRPCSPNKILISDIEIIRPGKRFLPIGFTTGPLQALKAIRKNINNLIGSIELDENDTATISFELAKEIVLLIEHTLDFEDGYDWDITTFVAIMKRFSYRANRSENRKKVKVLIKRGRNISRLKASGAYTDNPDDGNRDTPLARQLANDTCTLMLLEQNGDRDNGWKGTSFWWPVLVAPSATAPAVVVTNHE